jgi:chorismate-pyruvate lyase
VALFYPDSVELGEFSAVDAGEAPEPYRRLLHHEHHMTVTVEAFYNGPVGVRVLGVRRDQGLYARRILLCREPDGRVVQFGIVRLNLDAVEEPARTEIEAEDRPLGRVLIEHDVLREVEFHQLYRIRCGRDLADLFQVPLGTETYGRTALIYCNQEPAVELLEIIAPIE